MITVREPEEIEDALSTYHSELALIIAKRIPRKPRSRIVEIGAGPGTFTLPLLNTLDEGPELLYCVDSYTGPYEHDRAVLGRRLERESPETQVEIITADARDIGKLVSNIDLVVGHELLCDLNPDQVEQVMQACYEVLKDGGMFVHAGLSPRAESRAEELVQIADQYSEETLSDTTWFSPAAHELAGIAHRTGFSSIRVDYHKIPIRFLGSAAREMIRRWNTGPAFLERYSHEIERTGMEYPLEEIIYCTR